MSDAPSFDWYDPYIDEDGEIDHDRAQAWMDAAMKRLLSAPEGQALGLTDEDPVWIGMIQMYAHLYRRRTLARLSVEDLEELLLDVVPRKVVMEPAEAPALVAQLRALYTFARRAFEATEAEDLLEVLTDQTTAEVARRLGDPSYFGMAKSFVTSGQRAGFDMTSEEEMAKWAFLQNLSALIESEAARERPYRSSKERAKAKARRKMQRKSRKKNR